MTPEERVKLFHLRTEADVAGGRVGLLAEAAVVAGVLSAGLAAGDADLVLAGAADVAASRPQPQPADAAHKAACEPEVTADAIVAGQAAQVERLHQVQTLHQPQVSFFELRSLVRSNSKVNYKKIPQIWRFLS